MILLKERLLVCAYCSVSCRPSSKINMATACSQLYAATAGEAASAQKLIWLPWDGRKGRLNASDLFSVSVKQSDAAD